MKWLKVIVCGIFGIILTAACDVNQSVDDTDGNPTDPSIEQKKGFIGDTHWAKRNRGRRYQVISFEGSFFSAPIGRPAPHERCSEPAVLQMQAGEGKMQPLGSFSFHSTFCIDHSDIVSDGVLNEGDALPFYGEITTFTFANGDELYARGGSAVMPTNNPDYNAEFSNAFAILGGTGRFKGAQGGGATQSLVSFQNGTDHEFSGVIVLTNNQRGN